MQTIYEKIANYLRYLIEENKNNPNYRLPSEQQLQKKFSASRVSVRRAFKKLQDENLILSMKGKGHFINYDAGFDNSYEIKTTIAFIMTNPSNNFHQQILKGVNEYCNDNNIHLITYFSYNDPRLEQQKLIDAKNSHVDGIILFPCDNDVYSAELLKLINKKPIVLVDRYLKGLNLPCVSSKHQELAFNAVKYFYKKNLHDIVYICHQANLSSSTIDREEGIKNGLLKFMGQLNNNNFLHESAPPDKIYDLYLDYFSKNKHIKGVLATPCNEDLLRALETLKLKINRDIFMISIDESPESSAQTIYPSIIQNGFKIGYTAGEYVVKMLREYLPNTKQSIMIPVKYKNWRF